MYRTSRYVLLAALCFAGRAVFAQLGGEWRIKDTSFVFASPPFRQCHASTVLQTTTGRLLTACFGGSGEGQQDVAIWLADISSGAGRSPREVATGIVHDSLRYPAWNPVLFQERSGRIYLYYKIGPNPRHWWGMFIFSDDDGHSWSNPVKLPPELIGPVKNKPLQLSDGTVLSPSSKEYDNGRWQVHIERADKRMQRWTVIPVDTAGSFDVIQPSILRYPGDSLQLLCRSRQGAVMQSWSADRGLTWSVFSRTSLLNPNAGTDAVSLREGGQIIVYNPALPGKEWYNGRGKLRVAYSANGKVWQDVLTLEDGDREEYSYPAVIQAQDGSIHITYTYERRNIRHVVIAHKR